MKQWTLENLNNLGIYELREVAREVKVKSPTTKKRDELVELILKAQSGSLSEVASNKGRKPKKFKVLVPNEIKRLCDEDKKVCGILDYTDDTNAELVFNDDSFCECLSNTKFECFGVIRESYGKKYLYNYSKSIRYVMIEDELLNKFNINLGDFLVGEAELINNNFARLINLKNKNFSNYEQSYHSDNKDCFNLIDGLSKQELKNKFENYKNTVNLFLELEADAVSVKELSDKFYYIQTDEADPIEKSVNSIVDLCKIINILNNQKIKFNLVIYDIDYLYSILNVFNTSKKGTNDVDAGQCLKQLLTAIKQGNCIECIIVENKKYIRNLYLDSILNKYI